jgi:hypothetical protein
MKVRLLNKLVEAALDATGLPWEIELGTEALPVMLAGRQVCVLSKGGKARANAVSSNDKKNVNVIRRVADEIKRKAA